jgi:hypothetical protein
MLLGTGLDATAVTAREKYFEVPETKVTKALTLLSRPEHAVGSRTVTLISQIRLSSFFQYLTNTVEALKPHVSVLWSVTATATRGWIDPVGSPAEKERAWLELDEARSIFRSIFALAKDNPRILRKSLVSVIAPGDAAAIPYGAPPVIFAASDADGFDKENGGVISAGDLTGDVLYVGFGEDYVRYLRRFLETDSRAEIIYVLETLALVGVACERCVAWRGALVYYAIDSDNSKSAAAKMRSKRSPYVRYLPAILSVLSVRFDFRLVPFYV